MKKGFTLIELLAVIVILAIIALIATPIIINIINDSQEQSIKSSANLYVDGLSKFIMTKNMLGEFNPSSCTITNGNISCDGTSIDYTVNGDKPTSGTITFNNGVISGYTLCISDYKVTKSGNNVTSEKEANCTAITYTAYTMGDLVQYDPVNNSACTTGETCYKWRVITVGDTTSNSTITLQMDHNLINLSAWVSKTDYNDDPNYGSTGGNNNKGPITALKALETATSTWDNSLKLNYTYDTSLGGTNTGYNYGTLSCTNGACTVAGSQITSNLKARMITGEEVSAITIAAGAEEGTYAYNWTLANGHSYYFSRTIVVLGTDTNGTGSTDLSWLLENTSSSMYSMSTTNTYDNANWGYWTLSPTGTGANSAWHMYNDGCLYYHNVGLSTLYGIRPVITIPKSILE